MKYFCMTLGLALTVLALTSLGRNLWAQPDQLAQAPRPAQAGVKIGVVHMGVLFRNQERVKILKADLDVRVKPFEDKRAELDKRISAYNKQMIELGDKMTEEQRFEGQKRIFDCNRERQELDAKCHKEIGEHLGEEMVALDKEIRQTIKVYAEANGFQLILAYGEPDPALPPMEEIQRRMTAIDLGHLTFTTLVGGVDVTAGVLNLLDTSYRAGNGLPGR